MACRSWTIPWPTPRALAFCHNDLGAEHVLVDAEANTITGIIDWTDAQRLVHAARRSVRDAGWPRMTSAQTRY
ncbi:MAG TPA: phosphotransferase [Rubrobacteraceae bacterium]|nr:phosphotransferase [Rubrobacteraceae bacterium]